MASSSLSTKGRLLARALHDDGLTLHLPDLNRPCFEKLSVSAALEVMDELDARARTPRAHGQERWCLIGSSLGGYTAARWAELRPERVARLILLCPGFDMATWAPRALGEDAMRAWERDGELLMADAEGRAVPVHYGFVEDMASHPAFPDVPCPTLILHGRQDEVVPFETSVDYAATRAQVDLHPLDDDHALGKSHAILIAETKRFFEIC